MAGLALALLLGGWLLLWLARRGRQAYDLPAGRVVSRDVGPGLRAGETLYDPALDLAGRPDYVLEQRGRLIPVEVKSGRSKTGPHRSHRLQLAAYCRLVEAAYARRPPHGLLQYADRTFVVAYTEALRRDLETTLARMRRRAGEELDRSHASPERCRACGYREDCRQALA